LVPCLEITLFLTDLGGRGTLTNKGRHATNRSCRIELRQAPWREGGEYVQHPLKAPCRPSQSSESGSDRRRFAGRKSFVVRPRAADSVRIGLDNPLKGTYERGYIAIADGGDLLSFARLGIEARVYMDAGGRVVGTLLAHSDYAAMARALGAHGVGSCRDCWDSRPRP
jgi:hypothetical protein